MLYYLGFLSILMCGRLTSWQQAILKKKFSGQLILITGASSGIGRELAKLLSRCNAKLVLLARDMSALEKIKVECNRLGASAVTCIPCDVRDKKQVNEVWEKVRSSIGVPDRIIHNAGIAVMGETQHMLSEDWDSVMATNLSGPVELTKLAYPAMLERKSGHMVYVCSVASTIANPGLAVYTASKHALNGYAMSLAAEALYRGIKVTMIYPGLIATSFFERMIILGSQRKIITGQDFINKLPFSPVTVEYCSARMLWAIGFNVLGTMIGLHAHLIACSQKFFPSISIFSAGYFFQKTRRLLTGEKKPIARS